MKKSLKFFYLFTNLLFSTNSFSQTKNHSLLLADISLAKPFLYNSSSLNTENQFKTHLRFQPSIGFFYQYTFSPKWFIRIGVSVGSANAKHTLKIEDNSNFFSLFLLTRSTDYNIQISEGLNLSRKFALSLGTGLSLKSYSSNNVSSEFRGTNIGIIYNVNSTFDNTASIYFLASSEYHISKKSVFSLFFNFDSGHLPFVSIYNEYVNYNTSEIKQYYYLMKPRFFSVGISFKYRLWHSKN